jgi:hypothetical protein
MAVKDVMIVPKVRAATAVVISAVAHQVRVQYLFGCHRHPPVTRCAIRGSCFAHSFRGNQRVDGESLRPVAVNAAGLAIPDPDTARPAVSGA